MAKLLEVSIADAKARFARVVHSAEAGQAVRITRRGRPVAVLVSPAEFERLASPASDWVAFSQAWRDAMEAEGLPLLDEHELSGLRVDRSRASLDLG